MNGLRLWWETAVLAVILMGWIGIFWMALAKAMRWDDLFVSPIIASSNEDAPVSQQAHLTAPCGPERGRVRDNSLLDDEDQEQHGVLLLWPTDGRLH